jgi:N-acetylglutamate synthase-like GNAT family acetyltransferase
MSIAVRRAGPEEFSALLEFYRQSGYSLKVNPADAFYVADDEGALIGLVRLAREFEFTVLRGMRIAAAHQRRGVGTRLLRLLERDLGSTACYCIPYAHLVEFYGQIGFRVLDPRGAPAHLSERLASYRMREDGKQYTLMYRPGSRTDGSSSRGA